MNLVGTSLLSLLVTASLAEAKPNHWQDNLGSESVSEFNRGREFKRGREFRRDRHRDRRGYQCGTQPGYSFIIQDFENVEDRFLSYESQWKSAPSYSRERDRAYKRMTKLKNRLISELESAPIVKELTGEEIEEFTEKLETKWKNSPSYSLKRDMYYKAKTITWGSYQKKSKIELDCLYNMMDAFDAAEAYNTKWKNSPSYSQKRDNYYKLMQSAYTKALDLVDDELSHFRGPIDDIEELGKDFYNEWKNSPSYSLKRDTFYKASNKVFQKGQKVMKKRAPNLRMRRLERLADRFESAYRSSPSYSNIRDFYYKMSTIVNDEIDRRF